MAGLSAEAAGAAARLLATARGGHRTLPALPEDIRPATAAEAYAVQDAFADLWEAEAVGWKIGCTAEEQRRFLKVDEPFSGRIYAPVLLESPAEVSASAFFMRGIECEFAFRLGATLAPQDAERTVEEVAATIEVFHPAIEIVDSRYDDWLTVGGPSVVADNAVNGALVLGPSVENWRDIDLAAAPVGCVIDGKMVEEGRGALALGGPLVAMQWIANHLSARGIALEAGHVVTTGTCAGIHFVNAGQHAAADFGDLGRVEVQFTD